MKARLATVQPQMSRVDNAIVDNRGRRVGDFLCKNIVADSNLSIVSAYFTIYAYAALRDTLESTGRTRFLYGDPRGVGVVDPTDEDVKSFRLNEDGDIELRQVLAQKALARDCAAWIDNQVDIRTVKDAGFLHGKLYHTAGECGEAALVGSSNFTYRGLGFGAAPNIELNLEVRRETDRTALIHWFNALWDDEANTEDVKSAVLAALERLGRPYAPEFVYYKTLFHVFSDWLDQQSEQEGLLGNVHLRNTATWKKLYEFQKDGATSAINRLLRHNGCIVADSVGLGKTWTALAVIKFFELRNERVLVLCPKKLESNWTRYTAWAAQRNNPFEEDRFGYTVLAHTDLSRYEGQAGPIDLANFNWGAFDLIVIDESHNFRNESPNRKDDDGAVTRLSRYNRLLEEVIGRGVRTKVLMLSATPVNTSLRDLRNQVYLMTEKRRDAFREALGIHDIEHLFRVAQKEFEEWERARRSGGKKPDKAALFEKLSADFLGLLDAVTIARSREHLRRFYSDEIEQIGGFPKRAKPKNLEPPTDRDGELSYDDLHGQIGDFRLSLYMPSEYLKDASELEAEANQRQRERRLIGMMRVNLLKRLESSVHAFKLTTQRILERIKEIDTKIDKWEQLGLNAEIDARPEEDVEGEDDEFTVGKKRQYRLADIDVERWQHDLRKDRTVFENLHGLAHRVTVERDAKLTELKRVLTRKIKKAPVDQDDHPNRKVLVFTTFSDTARYLYDHLASWVQQELGVHLALVTGGDGNRSTVAGVTQFVDILGRFAPRAQNRGREGDEIDILVATDCLSEGQNLQDCDLVINYDIHWNPVRLMQRFGRIDRLGSRNREIGMINFWPTASLDSYLDLKNRVEARMALADAAATGDEDPLNEDAVQGELVFRDEQLKRLRDEILDVEEAGDGVTMGDLTLDDFLADLMQYIQTNRAALEAAPFGIYAIADRCPLGDALTIPTPPPPPPHDPIKPGVIFCLKHKAETTERKPSRLWPYYLVHVRDDGAVRYTFQQSKQCLALFRKLAVGRADASPALEDAFAWETGQGQQMEKYEGLLDAALKDIGGASDRSQRQALRHDGNARIAKQSEQPKGAESFELVTWLVIADGIADGTTADA